ncbi:Acetyltransferase (GNAT) domain-containing protein [Fictibacillus solisalsi]|uniref:Acetyltransferase (GNAT) domain-containing protein n=1 Tax=Fictibacillus solisalsi TaxID=459525 RepID=A0A1H0C3C5_9BACL|nr:GNAT family N-acetyltransferase [Fictibacillus solisalsi]SDN52369.1 Acetyltransferase (GNAT) domain-containing protein [Fictibacillus solisalsi]
MAIVYETNRLVLHVFDLTYLEDTRLFWGDDEVMVHCNGASPDDLLPKIIEGYRKLHHKYGLSVYAVQQKDTNRIIGAAGFNIHDGLEKIELIYHFNKTSWGKGYATEAARACMELAKQNKSARCVYATADPLNKGSFTVLEKAGFTQKGTLWCEDTKKEEPYYEFMF